jgi:hypothetical protein
MTVQIYNIKTSLVKWANPHTTQKNGENRATNISRREKKLHFFQKNTPLGAPSEQKSINFAMYNAYILCN